MPNRYQSEARQALYDALVERDGEECFRCHRSPDQDGIPLEIHHENDSPKFKDMRLACGPCNLKDRDERTAPRRDGATYYKKNLHIQKKTEQIKSAVDYSDQTAPKQMQANDFFEVPLRQWWFEKVYPDKSMTREDAIYGGAEKVGSSGQAAREYLKKAVSSEGFLQEEKVNGVYIITLKPEYQLTLENTSTPEPSLTGNKTTLPTENHNDNAPEVNTAEESTAQDKETGGPEQKAVQVVYEESEEPIIRPSKPVGPMVLENRSKIKGKHLTRYRREYNFRSAARGNDAR